MVNIMKQDVKILNELNADCRIFWSLPEELKPTYFGEYLRLFKDGGGQTFKDCLVEYAYKWCLVTDEVSGLVSVAEVEKLMKEDFSKKYWATITHNRWEGSECLVLPLIKWYGPKELNNTCLPVSEELINLLLFLLLMYDKIPGQRHAVSSYYENEICNVILSCWESEFLVGKTVLITFRLNKLLSVMKKCDKVFVKKTYKSQKTPFVKLADEIIKKVADEPTTLYGLGWYFPSLIGYCPVEFNHFNNLLLAITGVKRSSTGWIPSLDVLMNKTKWLRTAYHVWEDTPYPPASGYNGESFVCELVDKMRVEDVGSALITLAPITKWNDAPGAFIMLFDCIIERVLNDDVYENLLPTKLLCYVDSETLQKLLHGNRINKSRTLSKILSERRWRTLALDNRKSLAFSDVSMKLDDFNAIFSYFNQTPQ